MTRGDWYRALAAEVDALADDAADPEFRRQVFDLAERWRDLARQADENGEAAPDRLRPDADRSPSSSSSPRPSRT